MTIPTIKAVMLWVWGYKEIAAVVVAFIAYQLLRRKAPDNKYLSKKFLVGMTIIIVGFYLTVCGVIAGSAVAWIFTVAGGGYSYINVVAKEAENEPPATTDMLSRKFIISLTVIFMSAFLGMRELMDGADVALILSVVGTSYGYSTTRETVYLSKINDSVLR